MKRIAIYYHTNFGRNDGPPLYYKNQLEQLKDVELHHLIPEGDTSRLGKFDYHFWVDYGEDGLPIDHTWQIPKDGGKTIYVCSDAHIDKAGRDYRFKSARMFDYVFFNQVRALKEWRAKYNTKKGFWLPHAAEPQAYPHTEQIKKYDIGFIGHITDTVNYNGMTRVDMLDRAFKEFPNFYFGTRNPMSPGLNMFEDAAKKFNQSRIVLNITIKDDINMRFFETLSAGAFLLTNYIPTQNRLLKDGVHYATYKSYDDLVVKIKYYLNHEKARDRIAKAGHKEFMAHHTYAKRIEKIFETINPNKKDRPTV